jgi:hypothetical protein
MWLNHKRTRSNQPISTVLLIDTDDFHSWTMPMFNSDSDNDDMHFHHKLEGYEKESELFVVCIIIRVWCVINSGGFGVTIQERFVMNTLKHQKNLAYSV